MVNPFLSSTTERMTHWRTFRQFLASIPEAQQLEAVATYWAQAPLAPITSQPEPPWPTIWEMMRRNGWCRNTVAIGMQETLRLANLAPERMTLQWINDAQSSLLVLVIDHEWMLNYDWGFVRAVSSVDHTILRQWRYIDKDYILDG